MNDIYDAYILVNISTGEIEVVVPNDYFNQVLATSERVIGLSVIGKTSTTGIGRVIYIECTELYSLKETLTKLVYVLEIELNQITE